MKVLHNFENLTIQPWDKTSPNTLDHAQILTDHEEKVFFHNLKDFMAQERF